MTTDFAALYRLAFPPAGDEAPQAAASAEGRRCTAHVASTGQPCKNHPINGHHVCHAHGGKTPQVKAVAERNKQEAKALALARSYAGTDATRLAGDPIAALEWVISESHGLTARLAGIVRALTDEELRYTGKLGEQTRGELTALLRAMKDLSAMSERAIGLGIAERRLAIDRRQVELVVEALTAALNAAGLDLDGQHKAQQVLSRHLRAVEGGKSGG